MKQRLVTIAAAGLLAAVPSEPARAQDSARQTGEAWRIIPLAQSSLVFARDGSPIGEIGRENRTSVPLKSLPFYVPKAFVAIEGGGHFAVFMKSELFLHELLRRVRPLATRSRTFS